MFEVLIKLRLQISKYFDYNRVVGTIWVEIGLEK